MKELSTAELKEKYMSLADIVSTHDLICQCETCNEFLAAGDELIKRGEVRRERSEWKAL